MALARRHLDVGRKDVVEDDRGRPARAALDVDEVTQRELDQVHAVDEREPGRTALQGRERVGPAEVLVARLPKERRVVRKLGS